jgi:hypothetical protein
MKKKATKPKVKVAICGTETLTKKQAIDSARYLIQELIQRYDVRLIATVKEDLLGKAVRFVAKKHDLKLKTQRASDRADQSNPLELATAGLMWDAKRLIVVDDGGKGCAVYAMQMALRMKRKVQVFDI